MRSLLARQDPTPMVQRPTSSSRSFGNGPPADQWLCPVRSAPSRPSSFQWWQAFRLQLNVFQWCSMSSSLLPSSSQSGKPSESGSMFYNGVTRPLSSRRSLFRGWQASESTPKVLQWCAMSSSLLLSPCQGGGDEQCCVLSARDFGSSKRSHRYMSSLRSARACVRCLPAILLQPAPAPISWATGFGCQLFLSANTNAVAFSLHAAFVRLLSLIAPRRPS